MVEWDWPSWEFTWYFSDTLPLAQCNVAPKANLWRQTKKACLWEVFNPLICKCMWSNYLVPFESKKNTINRFMNFRLRQWRSYSLCLAQEGMEHPRTIHSSWMGRAYKWYWRNMPSENFRLCLMGDRRPCHACADLEWGPYWPDRKYSCFSHGLLSSCGATLLSILSIWTLHKFSHLILIISI